MERLRFDRVTAVAVAGCVVSATVWSRAETADDHAAAVALVQRLAEDSAHAPITSAAIAQAKEALERATRLRGAGDEVHAKAADGLAREWAETGDDLVRAVEAEERATDLRRKAVDARARLERTRALVEEGIARLGRLRAELEEARRAPAKDRTAVEMHAGSPAASKPERRDRAAEHPAAPKEKP
jgi:hypothetical protein